MSVTGKISENSVSGFIEFVEIPPQGLRLELTDTSWLVPEVDRHSLYTAAMFIQRRGERVIVGGEYELVFDLVCDRCQQQFKMPFADEFKIEFEPASSVADLASDHHCSDLEMDIVFYDEPRLDPALVLQQQLTLSMPVKRLCAEDCRGLCPRCGLNLNDSGDKCSCRQDNDSPFGVLAALKK